jgi:penicillin G amidase
MRIAAPSVLVVVAMLGPSRGSEARDDLRARARDDLARLDGKIVLAGLRAPVEVVRDRFGVPHIRAASEDDLFFAQGFVQAQDRLFQMEIWRRTTQGRLAELLGPEYVEQDRLTRLVTRFAGDPDVEWSSYDPAAERIAERFVAGINAFVDGLGGRRPLEFELAGLELEHWSHLDLLARAEAFGMSGNAVSEVTRARLMQALGPDLARRLKPTDPPIAVVPPPGLDLSAIDAGLQGALDLIGAGPRFGAPEKKPGAGYDDAGDGDGSNNWVVHGSRTASGQPLVANDPHRALDHPSLRYLVHLTAPGFNVIGAVVPWFPGVAIGHNDRVAWGLTIFALDAQDLFVEEIDAKDRNRYRVGDGFLPLRVEREAVRVRGSPSLEVELRFSRHGPIVYEDAGRHLAYALRWTGSEPGTAGYLAGLALDRARGGKDFREALRRWKMPGENFVYADVDGNIGYQAAGLAPVRRKGTGLLPAPGGSGEYDWVGFRRLEELPNAWNPAEGFLATSNNNTLQPGGPVVGYEWANRFRIDRVLEVLRGARKFDVPAAEALQQDVVALPARILIPMLRDVALEGELREAREMLVHWDLALTRDSAAAALFAAWQIRLSADFVESRLGKESGIDRARLTRSAGAQVLIDGLLALDGPERNALLRQSLAAAVADLTERLGSDRGRWRWGDLHRATFLHKLAVGEAERALFNLGPVERPGYGYTVNMTGGGDYLQNDGASFREVLDLGDWDRAVATSAPGQSGQPASSHFSDLLPYWTEGRYFPLAWSAKKVEEVAAHRLTLLPSR